MLEPVITLRDTATGDAFISTATTAYPLVGSGGVPEAPLTGSLYARQDGGWSDFVVVEDPIRVGNVAATGEPLSWDFAVAVFDPYTTFHVDVKAVAHDPTSGEGAGYQGTFVISRPSAAEATTLIVDTSTILNSPPGIWAGTSFGVNAANIAGVYYLQVSYQGNALTGLATSAAITLVKSTSSVP